MTENHSVNKKLLNLQLNRSKSTTKNANDITLRLSSTMIGINET